MRSFLAGTALALSILVPLGQIRAEDAPGPMASKGRKTIRIAMNDVTLGDGARMVGLLLKTRVEVSPLLKERKVSIRLNCVDGATALKALARVGGGVVARRDGGYLIATADEIEELGLPEEAILSDEEPEP